MPENLQRVASLGLQRNTVGTLAYHFQWGKLASKAYAGYRYVYLEYEDDPLDIQVAIRGPLVGIGFDF